MRIVQEARDAVHDVVETARQELTETVEELYPEPESGTGEAFGRQLGLWLTVGAVVLGVAAAVLVAFTED